MIRAIHLTLVLALLALPLSALAEGTATERPERGMVTLVDAELGELEVNGIEYSVPVGAADLTKVSPGSVVIVHFYTAGGAKIVTDLYVDADDD